MMFSFAKRESILWLRFLLSIIPGLIGCKVRNIFYGYKHGNNCLIWESLYIESPKDLILGSNVNINRGAIINACGGVEIGSNTIIGPRVTIYSQNHIYNGKDIVSELGYVFGKVIIGENVWIGSNVTILPNVIIGDNVVIGAGTIVVKSVESNVVLVDKIDYRIKNI